MIKNLTTLSRDQLSKGVILADQGIVSGASFVTVILLTKSLGVELFGVFTLGWMLVLLTHSLQMGFIISPMQALTAKTPQDQRRKYFGILLFKQLLFSSLIAIIFCCLGSLFQELFHITLSTYTWILFCWALFGFTMHEYFRRYFFVRKQTKKALLIDSIDNGLQLTFLGIAMVYSLLDMNMALVIISSSYMISIMVGVILHVPVRINFAELYRQVVSEWKFSRWLIGTSILQWISGNYFIITAGALIGPAAVTAIRISQNVMGILNIFFLILENHVPQIASKIYHQNGISVFKSYMRRISTQGLVVTAAFILLIILFAAPIIQVLYGLSDPTSILVLRLMALLYFIIYIGYPMRFTLLVIEKTRNIFITYVITSLFSLLLASIIIQSMGIWGVLIGLASTQLITQSWYLFTINKELKLSWK